MKSVTIGFNVSNTIPFAQEVAFAQAHDFACLQVWYDKQGFSTYDVASGDLEPFKVCEIPLLIHALLDVSAFDAHLDLLSPHLDALNLTELVVHPVSKSNISREAAMAKLCDGGGKAVQKFASQGVTVFFENNSKLSHVLQTPEELWQFFTRVPNAEFLLDVAHMDDYVHLQQLVDVKYPRILHVADRRLAQIHEHLPLGDGDIDFERVFGTVLKDFSGKIVIEGPFDFEARLRSKQRLTQIVQSV